jgi:hypothetical protein
VLPPRLWKALVVGGLDGRGVGVGWSWWSRSELASLVIGEREPVVAAGIAVDAEDAEMHHPVVHRAQGHEIVGVGAASVGPVHEVVNVELPPE